jgi:hypothetical protein
MGPCRVLLASARRDPERESKNRLTDSTSDSSNPGVWRKASCRITASWAFCGGCTLQLVLCVQQHRSPNAHSLVTWDGFNSMKAACIAPMHVAAGWHSMCGSSGYGGCGAGCSPQLRASIRRRVHGAASFPRGGHFRVVARCLHTLHEMRNSIYKGSCGATCPQAWRAVDRAYVDKGFNGQSWFRVRTWPAGRVHCDMMDMQRAPLSALLWGHAHTCASSGVGA